MQSQARINQIRGQIEETTSEFDKEKLTGTYLQNWQAVLQLSVSVQQQRQR